MYSTSVLIACILSVAVARDELQNKPFTAEEEAYYDQLMEDVSTNERNWKECAWANFGSSKQNGEIKSCYFNKKSKSSHLKVIVSSDMSLEDCSKCCKRWFVKFNGQECSPVPIDVVVFMRYGMGNYYKSLHRPRVLRGTCKIEIKGLIDVSFNIGKCPHYGRNANGNTGWISSTRIYIEEMNEPQTKQVWENDAALI